MQVNNNVMSRLPKGQIIFLEALARICDISNCQLGDLAITFDGRDSNAI
ncbi:helix-turn-helix domain-containing protein [Bifidobacterium pseudolongum]